MPEFQLCNRSDGLLEAASDESLDVMRQLPRGAVFNLKYQVARNPQNHRRWFAFVKTSFDMQDQYEDREIWRKVLQMLAGHFDEVVDKNGQTHYWPRSISFKELDDEIVFRDLFRRAVSGFLGRYGNGMSEADFVRALDFA